MSHCYLQEWHIVAERTLRVSTGTLQLPKSDDTSGTLVSLIGIGIPTGLNTAAVAL